MQAQLIQVNKSNEKKRNFIYLWSVTVWQLRRIFSERVNWLIPFVGLGIGLLLAWSMRDTRTLQTGHVVGVTTAWGGMIVLTFIMQFISYSLPFLLPRLVGQDKKERTQDLISVTQVPTSSYLGGRYLALAVVSVVTGFALLSGILISGLALHFTNASRYPLPNVAALAAVTFFLTLGTLILLTLAYCVYILLPLKYDFAVMPLLIGWLGLGFLNWFPASLAAWDPTFNALNLKLFQVYKTQYEQVLAGSAEKVTQEQVNVLANQMPDFASIFVTYPLILALAWLILVGCGYIFARYYRVQN